MDDIRRACVVCNVERVQPVFVIEREGMPHGSDDHNFVQAHKVLSRCLWCGYAQLEVFSHDCFQHHEDEPWDMWWWYAIPPEDAMRLYELAARCTAPLEVATECALREQLRAACVGLWGGVPAAAATTGRVPYTLTRLVQDGDALRFEVQRP